MSNLSPPTTELGAIHLLADRLQSVLGDRLVILRITPSQPEPLVLRRLAQMRATTVIRLNDEAYLAFFGDPLRAVSSVV